MKLIIQIPCLNEESSLPVVLATLPRHVNGFHKVEWLIIDDGSSDKTAEVARQLGVDHILVHTKNQGLAQAFLSGINTGLKLGADVIVNMDADNQYRAADIPTLLEPILQGRADMVIGTRPIDNIDHFSTIKKILQKLGSLVVRMASRTEVPDAPSGFRALSREAALKLNVFDRYSYTLETIIQAGQKNMAVVSVPVGVNKDLRPSRLIKSIPSYVLHSINTILRIFIVYRPFRFFMGLGVLLFGLGFLLGLRFLWFYFGGEGAGHIQSVVLSGALLGMGFQTMLVAILADLLSVNRRLLEDVQIRVKTLELDGKGSLRDYLNTPETPEDFSHQVTAFPNRHYGCENRSSSER
jgi:glycosyltransferase involved in cell wall biosynthesis